MKINNALKVILIWLPSLLILLFFVPNALDKIMNNGPLMIGTEIFLLISSALFLYQKTMLIGTFFLAFYSTFIIIIHMYRGKPHEVIMLIAMANIFAEYIRKPALFNSK